MLGSLPSLFSLAEELRIKFLDCREGFLFYIYSQPISATVLVSVLLMVFLEDLIPGLELVLLEEGRY